MHTALHLLYWTLALVAALATLPLVLELLLTGVGNLLPRRQARGAGESPVRLQVLVPAHNEALLIGRTVASLQKSNAASADARAAIAVIAHNCTDNTAALAEAQGAVALREKGPAGKGYALESGFAYARAQGATHVMVVDADSTVSENLMGAVIAVLADGADAAQARYELDDAEDPKADARKVLQGVAFSAFNLVRARGRAGFGLSCGIFGNGFALSLKTLDAVPFTAHSLAEDLEYHLRLVSADKRVQFVEHAVVWGAGAAGESASNEQRARWEGGRFRLLRETWREFAGLLVRGRWQVAEPLLDLAGMPIALAAVLLIVELGVPLSVARIYGAIGIVLLVVHLGIAIARRPSPGRSLSAMLRVPGYVIWKIGMLPLVLRRSSQAATWTRTQREGE